MLKYKLELEHDPDDDETHLAGLEGTFASHISESAIIMMMMALDEKNSALGNFDQWGMIRLANQSPGEVALDNTILDIADLQISIATSDFVTTRLLVRLVEANLRYAHALLAVERLTRKAADASTTTLAVDNLMEEGFDAEPRQEEEH